MNNSYKIKIKRFHFEKKFAWQKNYLQEIVMDIKIKIL